MKVTTSWINEWLRRTMLDDNSIVQSLELAGIEVEQVIMSKQIDKRVVVALVKKVVQHPGADRLKLVQVETGEGMFNVVCGAPNVREGQKVAFAQIGTVLPDGDRIAKAKLRGEISEGMLCSAHELKIGKDHNGILELSTDFAVGTLLCDIYPSVTVVDVKTPANRFDLQSIVGLAREVAAITTSELIPLSPPPVESTIDTSIVDKNMKADRFFIAKMKVSAIEPSPLPIVSRLRSIGVRSVNAVVDITNYVLLETGQPLHAYDADKVTLPITVRQAKNGETLVTLDGVKRKLSEADLVVADAVGPIGLAGVMGGQSSEVTSDTREILLEAGTFDSAIVRKMAKRHGLRTEASARFERGIPPQLPPIGLARAIQMLNGIVGAQIIYVTEKNSSLSEPNSLDLPVEKLSRLLGFVVSHKDAVSALERLQIITDPKPNTVKLHDGTSAQNIHVPGVPWWRTDLKVPEDLVEEIVRMIGYDKISATIPSWKPTRIEFDRIRALKRQVRDVLWGAGTFEVMTYSFVSAVQLTSLGYNLDDHLKLKNPLSIEQAYLRSSLLPSHLTTLERNRKYAKIIRFYEISKVFLMREPGLQPYEPLKLAVTVCEPKHSYSVVKGILDTILTDLNLNILIKPAQFSEAYAIERFAEIWLDDVRIGEIGQLSPRRVRELKITGEAALFEIDLTVLLERSRVRTYNPRSAFPNITRDIAMLVPNDVTWQQVREITSGWDVSFVSDYYGTELPDGMRGMTIRVVLSYLDRTPTEPEAADLETMVITRLGSKLGIKARK